MDFKIQSGERSAGRGKEEKKVGRYVVNTGGGGVGFAGEGCRMEFVLVCAGNLPVLPRCHR